MKKSIIFLAPVLFSFISSFAQDGITITGTKLAASATPQQVVAAVKQQFPDAKSVEYFKVPKDGVVNGWQVSETDNLASSDAVDSYSVKFTQGAVKYYALFDKDGNLLQSRYENTNTNLPDPIKNSLANLATQYPGYTVKTKSHYKIVNGKDNKDFYEVVATNGKQKKTLYYTPDGTITRVK